MYGDELKSVIEEYLRDSKAEYAVMIDGDWGSGKTYFLKHSLMTIIDSIDNGKEKQRKSAYVSLYGMKSIGEVSKEILFQCLGNKNSNKFKAANAVFETASNILTASLGAINMDLSKVDEIFSKININDWIICFDDLERCCFSINEMLGYINRLVEHNNCKVIILANEKEIGKITLSNNLENKYQVILSGRKYNFGKENHTKGDKPNESIDVKQLKKETENLFNEDILYGSIKEKVIGLKIHYEPQIEEVFDSIISDLGNSSKLNKYLEEKKSHILNCFKDEHCNNLRTLISALKSIKRVYEEMVKNSYNTDQHFDKIMSDFVEYITLLTIYYKRGGKIADLQLTTEIGYVTALGQNIFSQTRGFKFLEKYCTTLNFSNEEFTRVVALLRKEYDEEEKRTQKAKFGLTEGQQKLSNWWEKEDGEVEDLIQLLRKEVEDDKYSYESYQGIIGRLIQLKSYGYVVGDMDELIEKMNDNINKSDEPVDIERNSFSFENGTDLQKEYDKYVNKLKLKVDNKNHSIKSDELSRCLNDDVWAEKLLKYCEEHYNDFLLRYGFIDLLDMNNLNEKMKDATVKEIWLVRDIFDVVYHVANINEFFANDLNGIEDFRKQIENTTFDGINKKLAKKSLLEYLDDIIIRLKKEIIVHRL